MVRSMEKLQTQPRRISPRPPKSSGRLIGHVTPPPRRKPLTTARSVASFRTPEPVRQTPKPPVNYLQKLREKRIESMQNSESQLEIETPNWQGIL